MTPEQIERRLSAGSASAGTRATGRARIQLKPTNNVETLAALKTAIIRCQCGKLLKFEKAAHSGTAVCGTAGRRTRSVCGDCPEMAWVRPNHDGDTLQIVERRCEECG